MSVGVALALVLRVCVWVNEHVGVKSVCVRNHASLLILGALYKGMHT